MFRNTSDIVLIYATFLSSIIEFLENVLIFCLRIH